MTEYIDRKFSTSHFNFNDWFYVIITENINRYINGQNQTRRYCFMKYDPLNICCL